MSIAFGHVLDVVGRPRRHQDILIVPALVEIEDSDEMPRFLLREWSVRKPNGLPSRLGDALWVRARLPVLYQFSPLRVRGDARPYLLDVGFCAIEGSPAAGSAFPFACRDRSLWTGLVFSRRGPNSGTKRRIADAFWTILQGPPEGLSEYVASDVEWDEDPGQGPFELRIECRHGTFSVKFDENWIVCPRKAVSLAPSASCNPSRKPYNEDVPTILRERGFRFFFYMADRFEPAHVHVQRDDCAAKLWLDPLEFAFVEGFRRHEANDILHITERHRNEFLRAWYKTFGDLSHE